MTLSLASRVSAEKSTDSPMRNSLLSYSLLPLLLLGFPGGTVVENLPANAGDVDSIPGAGTSPAVKVKVKLLSCVGLFATPWTVACTRLLRPWDFLGKSTGVGCHFHSSILAWEIPWSRGDGGLQSMGLQRVRYAHTLAGRVSSWSLAAGPRDPHTHLGSLVGRMAISWHSWILAQRVQKVALAC